MDGAVPGKVGARPVLIWDLQTIVRPTGQVAAYAVVSHAETGEFEVLNAEELVSVDWRLLDGAWTALYDDGSDEEEPDEPEPKT